MGKVGVVLLLVVILLAALPVGSPAEPAGAAPGWVAGHGGGELL